MRLNENFHVKRISKPVRHSIKDTYTEYKFEYKDINVQLDVGFDLEATTGNGFPVYNFGYGLDIYRNDAEGYTNLIGFGAGDDGRRTKRYFDCKESRGIVSKFVRKSIDRDINTFKFPIFVRGPLTVFKQNSPRYIELDTIINKYGYKKIVIPVRDMNNYLPHSRAIEDESKDVYWFYILNHVDVKRSDLCNLYHSY